MKTTAILKTNIEKIDGAVLVGAVRLNGFDMEFPVPIAITPGTRFVIEIENNAPTLTISMES